MSVVTYEGVVENGQIRLKDEVRLPEHTTVYVLVPEVQHRPVFHVVSPRLVNPHDVTRFTMERVEEPTDAGV